jgi:hypothetical protein
MAIRLRPGYQIRIAYSHGNRPVAHEGLHRRQLYYSGYSPARSLESVQSVCTEDKLSL